MFLDKKYFKIFIVLMVVGFTFGVLYYVLPLVRTSEVITVTETVVENADLPDEGPSLDVLVELNSAYTVTDYWTNWNREKQIAKFIVSEVDTDNGTLSVSVSQPLGHSFSEQLRVVNFTCAAPDTYAVSSENPTTEIGTSDFYLKDLAKRGDIIHSFCLDEDCLNAGGGCVLVQF